MSKEEELPYRLTSHEESGTRSGEEFVPGKIKPVFSDSDGLPETTDTAKPPLTGKEDEKEVFTNANDFQDFVTNSQYTVPVNAFVLVAGGLPESWKTTLLEEAFDVRPSAEKKFTHHEFVAGRLGRKGKFYFKDVERDKSFLFTVLSGLVSNNKEISFSLDTLDSCTFVDPTLRSYTGALVKSIYEERNQGDESKLENGIGLVNLWDTSINKTTRPFLECIGGCLKRSLLWLFVDLDQDLHRLHMAPEKVGGDKDSMKWRSQIEYLLRKCHLCKNSQFTGDGRAAICTIFATYSSKTEQNRELEKKRLRKEFKNAARQMGCKKLIDFDIVLIDKEDPTRPLALQKKMITHLKTVQRKKIPLSWALLRGYFKYYSDFYITYCSLKQKAAECGLHSDESLDEFCTFFSSFGSIFDIRQVTQDLDYVIVNPSKFLFIMDRLLNKQKEDGIIKLKTDVNQDEIVVMEILVSLALALKPQNLQVSSSEPTYYVPTIRSGERKRFNDFYTPGTVQFILSMGSPRVNMTLQMAKYLLMKLPNAEFDHSAIKHINSIVIKTTTMEDNSTLKVVLTSQGDVVEISLAGWQKCKEEQVNNMCKVMVQGTKCIIPDESACLPNVQYHFAIRCNNEILRDVTPYVSFQRRHVLPICNICVECEAQIKGLRVIDAWNKALEENPIPEQRKLNGEDLSSNDISKLSEEIGEYPEDALSMLARKLNVKTYFSAKKEKLKPKVLAMGLLVEWQSTPDAKESPKKVLAGHLAELDGDWKCLNVPPSKGLKVPKFFKLAQQLDIRVYTPDQIEKVKSQRSKSLVYTPDQRSKSLDGSGLTRGSSQHRRSSEASKMK